MKGNAKLDWKREEKGIYLPKTSPELVTIPSFRYFTIAGSGNPNSPWFGEYIQTLYALSYAIRMSPKRNLQPDGYVEYSVYPLEGVWSLTEQGKRDYAGTLDKDQLAFVLMIRQPDFITEAYALETIKRVAGEKRIALADKVRFEELAEGRCVQMLHIGSYDDEPGSFRIMEAFATDHGLRRIDKTHREIYLGDPGRVAKEKLKTVLRFRVE